MNQDKRHAYILVGGLVAMGFDASGKYLLTVSHSGRGVFSTGSWERVARDSTVLYPSNASIQGIGPLAGANVDVLERDERTEQIVLRSLDGRFELFGESDGITVRTFGA
jgi:hypothetical protein